MISKEKTKQLKSVRRRVRVRARVTGTKERPRLSVFRSLKYFYGQLVDDASGTTLVSVSDRGIKIKKAGANDALTGKRARAYEVGKLLGTRAKDKGIQSVVFDRNRYKYHGRVKAFADGVRAAGIQF